MAIGQQEIIKRVEKIRDYHKLAPIAFERLHINRGRQLMYELLKDVFGDPMMAPGKQFNGDWEMLFTQLGVDSLSAAISLQIQQVQQKAIEEQQKKIELGILRLASQTTSQVKALLLDTAIGNLTLKKPGEISLESLVARLENDYGKGPTPPEGEKPFTWLIILEQQKVAGLKAWVEYELKVVEYQLSSLPVQEEKPDKINFELRIVKNRIDYLKELLKHLQ
ncbi:MAG: hypothetical protein JNN15_00270 [Blastocatellia bacterium]|nr:hypothetical protein [Blastocatellia bacterium]